jgi:hypothetical protein
MRMAYFPLTLKYGPFLLGKQVGKSFLEAVKEFTKTFSSKVHPRKESKVSDRIMSPMTIRTFKDVREEEYDAYGQAVESNSGLLRGYSIEQRRDIFTYSFSSIAKLICYPCSIIFTTLARYGPNAPYFPQSYYKQATFIQSLSYTAISFLVVLICFLISIIWIQKKVGMNIINSSLVVFEHHFKFILFIFSNTPIFVIIIILEHLQVFWFFTDPKAHQ